jgi:hypothetical protein
MTHEKGRKLEPPLKLDMSFGEALSRFVATKPEEVAESVERSRQKKPPGEEPRRLERRSRRELLSPNRQRKPDESGAG